MNDEDLKSKVDYLKRIQEKYRHESSEGVKNPQNNAGKKVV